MCVLVVCRFHTTERDGSAISAAQTLQKRSLIIVLSAGLITCQCCMQRLLIFLCRYDLCNTCVTLLGLLDKAMEKPKEKKKDSPHTPVPSKPKCPSGHELNRMVINITMASTCQPHAVWLLRCRTTEGDGSVMAVAQVIQKRSLITALSAGLISRHVCEHSKSLIIFHSRYDLCKSCEQGARPRKSTCPSGHALTRMVTPIIAYCSQPFQCRCHSTPDTSGSAMAVV